MHQASLAYLTARQRKRTKYDTEYFQASEMVDFFVQRTCQYEEYVCVGLFSHKRLIFALLKDHLSFNPDAL